MSKIITIQKHKIEYPLKKVALFDILSFVD